MKFFLKIIFILLITFYLIGCSMPNGDYESEENNNQENIETINHSERKIIYSASAKLITSNLADTLNDIRDYVTIDGWLDKETHSERQTFLIIRINTSRFDDFIELLSDFGEVQNLNKEAVDISLQYQKTSNKIDSLEAERSRLVELIDEAALHEIIQINTRMAEIDLKLGELEGTLNQYDSLIEYSTVNLTITVAKGASTTPYGKKLSNALISGFKAVKLFFEYLLIAITTILPFLLVLSPIGITIGVIYHRKKKKSINKKRD